jgi:putative Mg2+ transporter-C (MgtC) family protein
MMTGVELTIVLRAALAGVLGFLIGWGRTLLGEPIQARTIAVAATTAATLVALTEMLYPEETARVLAGVVTGIGFLGAGTILRSSTGEVHGLTTAASLWAMSAIGMAVGSGHELLGVLLTLVIGVIMTFSEWPVMTRLARYLAQKRAEVAGSQPCPPPPEREASDDPPAAK